MVSKKAQNAANASQVSDRAREPGYSRLAHQIREEIIDGRVAAGARLKVSEIAQKYGTSTNPAREALQVLEGEGLVTITPNRGAQAREITEDTFHNVFDIKKMLWAYIVRSFVEFASAEEVAELRRLQEGCAAAVRVDDYNAFHKCNVQFHNLIVNHHFNDEAIAIIRKHESWLRALSRKEPLKYAQMRRSVAEHWRIVEAIESGDPEEAIRAMDEHIDTAHRVFRDRLRRKRLPSTS